VQGVLAVATVPVIVPLLGTEAYGIVGLVAVLQIFVATLDIGLSTTVTREVARVIARGDAGGAPAVVRTLEVVYWSFAVAVVAIAFALSGWLASAWLNVQTLSPHEVRMALLAAGVAIAVRWPVSLYGGVLAGYQLQVRQNAVTIAAAVVRFGGGVLIVVFVSRTIAAYMAWQAVAALLEVAAMGTVAWRSTGGLRSARFDRALIAAVWRYMVALNIVSAAALVITQVDRIVTAIGAITHISAAVSAAVFPRFTTQLERRDDVALLRTYRQAANVIGFLVVGTSLPLAFFAHDILSLWVGSKGASQHAATAMSLLAVAYLCNALYATSYTLAIASGHTRIPLVANFVAAPVFVIAMLVVVPRYRVTGAAALDLTLMACFFVVYGVWVHSVALRGEWARSVVRIAARYAAVGLAAFGGARLIADAVDSSALSYALLAFAFVTYFAVAGALLPDDVRFPWPRLRLGGREVSPRREWRWRPRSEGPPE
jgi:O-antigen/teichoic acid export membrane protein